MDDYSRAEETDAERIDRNWNELLQELRVSQTGVQVLTGFLLTLPLQPRFAELSAFERNSYVTAISLSILATLLLIAPVSMHRILFQKRRKESLVSVGSGVAKAGLLTLALSSAAVVTFVFSLIFGERTASVVGSVTLALFAVGWLVLPLMMRARHAPEDS